MANVFKKLLLSIFELKMPPQTKESIGFAEDFRKSIAGHVEALSDAPTESERSWHGFNEELKACAKADDPRDFLQWGVIRRSMFVSNASYIASELRYLKQLPTWKERWKAAITETPIGRPRPYPRHPKSSGNLIHHAYHLARFEEEMGVRVDELGQVFEFGGGYGSMARLFRNLGFSGQYLIFDFPYFSALQRFFLRSIGMWAEHENGCSAGSVSINATKEQICCLSDKNALLELLELDGSGRLFLATWSMSETPLVVREEFMPHVRDFDCFLIAFQHQFEEIDNTAYFSNWVESMGPGYQWRQAEITHLPGNSYLFGKRVA